MSISDIAKLAKTSPATVSRILNNPDYHCQNEDVRKRVWKAAMELNYVPNEAARNLKKGIRSSNDKVKYIQVLMTRTERSQADPFFTEILRVVETEIHNNACILTQVWYMSIFSNDNQCAHTNIKKLVDELYDETGGRSDGLIVIGKCNKEVLKLLKNSFKNVVSINRNTTNKETDEVTCDGEKIADMAVDYLIRLRHTDIGYVGECSGESRYKGFVNALMKRDIVPNPSYIYDTKQTETAGFDVGEKLLKTEDKPTAIYCANDITAIGMLKALEKSKNKYVNISVISSDDIEQAQFSRPMLTTVSLPKEEMARFAVYLLISRITRQHESVTKVELEGKLVVRESCVDVEYSRWNYYI